MSTPSIPATDVSAGASAPTSGKKLRFDLDEPAPTPLQSQQPKLRSALKSTTSTTATDSGDEFSVSAVTPKQHSSRRGSEAVDALHVTLNAAPDEVIEAASSPTAPESPGRRQRLLQNKVTQLLADIGVGANGGDGTGRKGKEALRSFRPLLEHTAALLLAKKPAYPERFLADHFYSRSLGTSAVTPDVRAPATSDGGSTGIHDAGAAATNYTTGESDTEGRSFSGCSNAAGGGGAGDLNGGGKTGGPQPIVFAPVGDTVAQRLAFPAPLGVGRSLAERVARLLLDVKPDDPETFLWTKLDSRNFSEEVATSALVAFTPDGFPLLPPEDPTQAALLREIPVSSPGYGVAANVIPLLFAKKPDDPLNYLFLHLTSRARSSAAGSVRSSNNRQRCGEEDNTSCTSRDMEYDDDGEREDVDDDIASMSRDGLSPEKDAVVSSFLSNLQRKTAASGSPRRRSLRSASGGEDSTGGPHRRVAGTRASTGCGARRVSSGQNQFFTVDSSAASPTGNTYGSGSGGGGKRVCISESHNLHAAESPMYEPSPTYHSYGEEGGSTTTFLATGAAASESFSPSFLGSGAGAAAAATSSDPGSAPLARGELTRLRDELHIMKLRGAMRLERVGYEVDILRQERDHLARLAAIDRGEHASRALRAAAQALGAAEAHLQVLEARQSYLITEMMPRQLRTMTELMNQQQQQQQQQSRTSSFGGDNGRPFPVQTRGAALAAGGGAGDIANPSELDILRKRVELLTMEQSRLRTMSGSGVSGALLN